METVPTLIRRVGGRGAERAIGGHRGDWEAVTGIAGLGTDLPEWRPGCGSKSVEPGMAEILKVRFGDARFSSRPIEVGTYDDPVEAAYERGRSEEHTSELQSLMRISYAVFCLQKNKIHTHIPRAHKP